MATTELTGAEDVAWDLGDLYAGIDDPTIESDVAQAEQDAAAFRERYHGTVAGLDAAALAEAVAEYERIESALVRPLTFAHLVFATNMADPARGALVARLGEKAATLDTQLLFFGLEWAAVEDDAAEALLVDPALDHWRHHLQSLRKFRPYLLSEPEERIVTEKTVSGSSAWSRLYEELLGAMRVTLDGEEVAARAGDGDAVRAGPRHAPRRRRGDHGGARPGAPHAHVRVQHDPAGQVDRRPAARLPDLALVSEPRERDDGRGGRGADPRDDLALRPAAAVLPAQGAAARARPARALRPLRADLVRRGSRAVGRGTGRRGRRVLRLLRGDRLDHRAVLRRQLDRRAGAPGQADGRVLRDHDPRRAPVRADELHGRPPLDPDARTRARSRAPRRARAAARLHQLVDPADHRGDGLGLR